MAKVAFLGLGVMGFPMAGHLAKAGHDVTVYNRTGKKADDWVGRSRFEALQPAVGAIDVATGDHYGAAGGANSSN